MQEVYVYWLHLPGHTDMFREGYIGISNNPQRRFYGHKKHTENQHLRNAFLKYKDIISSIVLKGSREYCLLVEEKIRPENGIGWNIIKGGGEPPSQKGKSKTEKTKAKLRKPKPEGFGKGQKNSMYGKKGSCNGKKWYYDPITKYSNYFIPGQQPSDWIEGRYSRKKIK